MTNYENDIYYNTEHLSLIQKRDLMQEAHKICHDWHVETVKTSQRERIEMTFEDILSKFDDSCFFSFIYRKGWEERKDNKYFPHSWCLEIAFITLSSPSYFLWIYVPDKYLNEFKETYDLKERKN